MRMPLKSLIGMQPSPAPDVMALIKCWHETRAEYGYLRRGQKNCVAGILEVPSDRGCVFDTARGAEWEWSATVVIEIGMNKIKYNTLLT